MRRQPFERIVEIHGDTVFRVCRAVLDESAAEDAWSETFLAALRAYPDLRPESNIEAWLVTIAHRKAIDQVRKRPRATVALDGAAQVPSTTEVPGDWHSDLFEAIRGLPPKQRQAVAYHHLAGLPYAEIARIIGGTAEAARRAGADGVATLRKIYQGEPA
jgi:RNA polymerase sigma factor (sigma-70 family)